MSTRQTQQGLDEGVVDRLSTGDPDARVEQLLVSSQNSVVLNRAAYNRALLHRAECIALAHAAGWSKYRIAKRLGITRRAVDEALERPTRSPSTFLAELVKQDGGHENLDDRRLKSILNQARRLAGAVERSR
jgi:lambda repressor-like predicted transcriptional regulator